MTIERLEKECNTPSGIDLNQLFDNKYSGWMDSKLQEDLKDVLEVYKENNELMVKFVTNHSELERLISNTKTNSEIHLYPYFCIN